MWAVSARPRRRAASRWAEFAGDLVLRSPIVGVDCWAPAPHGCRLARFRETINSRCIGHSPHNRGTPGVSSVTLVQTAVRMGKKYTLRCGYGPKAPVMLRRRLWNRLPTQPCTGTEMIGRAAYHIAYTGPLDVSRGGLLTIAPSLAGPARSDGCIRLGLPSSCGRTGS